MSSYGPLAAGQEGPSRIHQASLEVLAGTGVRFAGERALALFRRHGYRVEGQRVFFTEKPVLNALQAAPGSFTILARNPRHNLRLAPGVRSFGLGRGAITWVQPDGSHRRGTRADLLAATRLCQRRTCSSTGDLSSTRGTWIRWRRGSGPAGP